MAMSVKRKGIRKLSLVCVMLFYYTYAAHHTHTKRHQHIMGAEFAIKADWRIHEMDLLERVRGTEGAMGKMRDLGTKGTNGELNDAGGGFRMI